jgi:hypothetical protein
VIALAAQGARAPLDALPAAVRWLLAIGAMLAWLALHSRWLDLSRRVGRLAGAAIRAAVGFAALYLTALALQSWLTLATDWPVWGVALGAAAAVEAVLALYAVERSTVSPAAGRTIAVLRVGAALLL